MMTDEEEEPDEDDEDGEDDMGVGLGESRCRSLVVAWVDASPGKRCNGKGGERCDVQSCNVEGAMCIGKALQHTSHDSRPS